MDSQNSLKAVILTVTVYCSEKIQIKIRQRKKDVGQGPREFQTWSFQFSPPSRIAQCLLFPAMMWMMWNMHGILLITEVHPSLGVECLLGLGHINIAEYTGLTLAFSCWTENMVQPPPNPTINQYIVSIWYSSRCPDKRRPRQDTPRA